MMKTVRKRQLLKAMKPRVIKLMDEFYQNEYSVVVHGVVAMSEKREHSILKSLNNYAEMIERNDLIRTDNSNPYWLYGVLDFLE